MTTRPDETHEFWEQFERPHLIATCAALHEHRRKKEEARGAEEIDIVRRTVGQIYLRGNGVEVGAGDRPFPIPETVRCFYGDIRDKEQLVAYFENESVVLGGKIDAQSMDGINHSSLDFVISAHVIEHVLDPVRAIKEAIRRLKPGGVFILVVPELTQTWDRRRPSTTLEHVLRDELDGGEGTREQAYWEHAEYVHPEQNGGESLDDAQKRALVEMFMRENRTPHIHAWREPDFFSMVDHIAKQMNCIIEARLSVVNENIYALRRR